MKQLMLGLFFCCFFKLAQGQEKTIHVFVALCDNENQGIVPVSEQLGNGQKPTTNLYWGAAYGIKNFFRRKAVEWEFHGVLPSNNKYVLERILFKHRDKDVFMIADAYDGARIKACIRDFLLASNQQHVEQIVWNNRTLQVGGTADLLAYVGHDGLMEFDVDLAYQKLSNPAIGTIVLACFSKDYFYQELKEAGAKPLLWTTHLMAPEAYTLRAAIEGWMLGESSEAIEERAAQAYNNYQKCGIKGARNLFTTGF